MKRIASFTRVLAATLVLCMLMMLTACSDWTAVDESSSALLSDASNSVDTPILDVPASSGSSTPTSSVPVTSSSLSTSEIEPPLIGDAKTTNVPDFLSEEQIQLYRRAYVAFPIIAQLPFGIEEFPLRDEQSVIGTEPRVILIDGMRYIESLGRYRNWVDFENMGRAIFTDDLFDRIVQTGFIENDGVLYYLDSGLGSAFGYNPEEMPDSFELVSSTENRIEFNLITRYYNSGGNERSQDDISTLTNTIVLVETENGWRFSLFNTGRWIYTY